MSKKIFIIFLIFIMLLNTNLPILQAIEIEKANLIYDHAINTHIMFYSSNTWCTIKGGFICYKIDGKKYPTYCISHGLHGVDEEGNYTVTINDLLKDKLIYNTILNGYPYKTPQQLGLNTEDEAYIATKQAIYSAILNRNVKEFYKAKDEIGKKIIDAIYNISESGKNGNAENQDPSLIINKIDNLKEDGAYYYQEYSVTSNVDIKKYTIENIENFGNGVYISDINGNKKTTFNTDEKFRVVIPKESFNTDISGKINIKANCNSNAIFFGEAPKNNVQNYAITYDPYANYNASTELNINTNNSEIIILKEDSETNSPIENVTFEIYNSKQELIDTKITNKEGKITLNNLYQGKYYAKEIKANDDYILDNNTYEIDVEYGKTIIKEIKNNHKKGNLKIKKVDKDDNKITLGGIEFDLIDEEGKIVNHLITDADGETYIENINTGKYIIKETKTKKEYNLCIDENIEIKWNETTQVIIKNEKKKGKIEIYKVDSEDQEMKIENTEFELLDENKNIVEKLITNENGYAISSNHEIGTYYIKEIKTDENYILDNNIYEVEIKTDEITSQILENNHKKGNLKIKKVDKDNNKVTLGGIEFDLINENGDIVKHLVTDANGEAYIENINTGKYTIKETKTKKEYNLCIDENIEIKWNETTQVIIENEKKKGKIEIYKVDSEDNNIKIKDVEFELLDENKNIVEKLITNDNGYAVSNNHEIGTYYIKETKTNSKYVLDSEIKLINIEDDKTLSLTIENTKMKGKIKIIKTTNDDCEIRNLKKGDNVSDVEFKIYDLKNNVIDTIMTDENGEAISKNLETGRYIIKETKKEKGFLENIKDYYVEIKENNKIEIVNIENTPIKPRIDIEKSGVEYAEKNEEIKYEFNIKNNSNSNLDSLTWIDYLPYDKANITKVSTGTYNTEFMYDIYYKTNLNDYILLKSVNSLSNEYIDLSNIELLNKEIITELKVEFKDVPVDFESIIKPNILMKVSDKVKKNDEIINKSDLIGTIDDYTIKDESSFKTIIKEKEIVKKLPKTGC